MTRKRLFFWHTSPLFPFSNRFWCVILYAVFVCGFLLSRKRSVSIMGLITKIFGTYSDRELKQIYPIVDKIEALEPEYKALTDQQLTAKTAEFKERLGKGETLDDILPEAFAAVREASVRVLGLRPYRVQLV